MPGVRLSTRRRAIFRCASASPYQSVLPLRKTHHAAPARITAQAMKQTIAETGLPLALSLKRRELPEFFKAGIDLFARQSAKTLRAEALAAETAHDGAVNNGAADFVRVFERTVLPGQVTHESAGKTVSGAGWIEHVFQQIARHYEVSVFTPQQRSVFTALDHGGVRPHCQNL